MSASPVDPVDRDFLISLRELAASAARVGGDEARRTFGRVRSVRRKADRSEVTDADEAAQRVVIAHIRAQRPDDSFIAEEATGEIEMLPAPRGDDLCWIIDPIDGTRNYIRAVPFYCCSVGVMAGGRPVAGAVYDPQRGVMYAGDEASGAFVDGQRVTLAAEGADRIPGSASTPIVAIPSTRHTRAHKIVHEWVDRLVVRNFGSTALHLAMVAAGQLDGALATNCRLWDVAAGALLITAAGGIITTPFGEPLFPLDPAKYAGEDLPCLAANRDLHPRLIVSPST